MTEDDALRRWREVAANHTKMKNTCWQLLTHPKATPEQLAQVRRTAVKVSDITEHIRQQLRGYAQKKRYWRLEAATSNRL